MSKKKKLEKIWVNLLTAVGVVVWTNSVSNATYTEIVTKALKTCSSMLSVDDIIGKTD